MIGSNEPHSPMVKNREPITIPGFGLVVMHRDAMIKYRVFNPKTMHVVLNGEVNRE